MTWLLMKEQKKKNFMRLLKKTINIVTQIQKCLVRGAVSLFLSLTLSLCLPEYSIFGYNMQPLNILNQNGRRMFLNLKNDLSYQMMNEPTHTTSPQELIICKINSEEDSIILAFTYRSPNPTNENLEYFNIAMECLGLSPHCFDPKMPIL